MLGAEIRAGEEQRGAFANAAAQFGKDVRIPSDAELLGWSASVGHFPSEPPPGWIGKWRMRWHGADYGWGISGVNYDAAFRNIVRGVVLAASGAGLPDRGN